MVLAFASGDSLEGFAREQGVSDEKLEDLVRVGLVRAVGDAERAGALDPTLADVLRAIARRIPVEDALDLLDRLPGF